MSNKFEPLNENEIVSLVRNAEISRIVLTQPTYKVKEFLKALSNLIDTHDDTLTTYQAKNIKYKVTEAKANWFSKGVDCEVLKLDDQGWQKGKVRLSLEFCPNEPEIEETPTNEEIQQPESPLDDLRRMINKETQ